MRRYPLGSYARAVQSNTTSNCNILDCFQPCSFNPKTLENQDQSVNRRSPVLSIESDISNVVTSLETSSSTVIEPSVAAAMSQVCAGIRNGRTMIPTADCLTQDTTIGSNDLSESVLSDDDPMTARDAIDMSQSFPESESIMGMDCLSLSSFNADRACHPREQPEWFRELMRDLPPDSDQCHWSNIPIPVNPYHRVKDNHILPKV